MSTLTISIDRSSLSLSPLVFSGNEDGTTWGILPGYTPPGRIPNEVLVSSPYIHGDVLTHWSYQSAFHVFEAFPTVASGAALKAAVTEVYAALGRSSYTVTTNWNGAEDEWECRVGSIAPSPIDLPELTNNKPLFSITIPCYPIAAP